MYRRAVHRLWKCHERRDLRQGTTPARAVVTTQCEDLMRIFVTENEMDLEALARAGSAHRARRPPRSRRVKALNPHLADAARIPKGGVLIPAGRARHQGWCRYGRGGVNLGEIADRFGAGTCTGEPSRGPPRVTHRRAHDRTRCAQGRGRETSGRERPAAEEAARGRRCGVQGPGRSAPPKRTRRARRSSPRPHRPNSRACKNSSAEKPEIRRFRRPGRASTSGSWSRDTLPTASHWPSLVRLELGR